MSMNNLKYRKFIPDVSQQRKGMNKQSVETWLVLFSVAMVVWFLSDLFIHQWLSTLFVIIVVIVLIILLQNSKRNEGKPFVYSMYLALQHNHKKNKLSYKEKQYKFFSLKNIFNRGRVTMVETKNSKKRNRKELLIKDSFDNVEIQNVQGEIVTLKDDSKLCITSFSFTNANGLQQEQDDRNHENFNLLLQNLNREYKLVFRQYQQTILGTNLDYVEDLLHRENNTPTIQSLLEEQQDYMNFYNQKKYSSMFAHLHIQDKENFTNNATDIDCKFLKDKELTNYLQLLINGEDAS